MQLERGEKNGGNDLVQRFKGVVAALAILLAVSVAANAQASEFGARAYGMGGAYTGVASDMSALIYNPAGLTYNVFEASLGLGGSNLAGVSTLYAVLQDPASLIENEVPPSTFNLSVLSGASFGSYAVGFAADGTLDISSSCKPGVELCADGELMTQIIGGAGFNVVSLPVNLAGLQVGVSLKRLDGVRFEFAQMEPAGGTFDAVTRRWDGEGFSATVGALMRITDMVTLGVAAQDVLSSVRWSGTQQTSTYSVADGELVSESTEVKLPDEVTKLDPVLRIGASVRPPIVGLTLAADLATDGTLRYGVEKTFLFGLFAVRAGQILAQGDTTTTLGLGVNVGPIHFDAGFGASNNKNFGLSVEGSVRF